jgi:hypothetical protein
MKITLWFTFLKQKNYFKKKTRQKALCLRACMKDVSTDQIEHKPPGKGGFYTDVARGAPS